MLEPSSGNHYMLLPLTGNKDICIGAFSSFVAAKLTVASKHCSSDMGVHPKLPPNFSPQLDSDDLITEPTLCCGSIWKNADFVFRGDSRCPLLVDGEPVAMESLIKVALVDQFMPLQCATLTNVGYEPKFMNEAFTFRETVEEMRQHLNREKVAAVEKKPPEPMITNECHQEALATAQAPMFASKSSDIDVVLPSGAQSANPVKYPAFLGVKGGQEEAATAQTSQDTAAIKVTPMPANAVTGGGDTNPQNISARLCEALAQMTDSLEHLKKGYFDCFNETVVATREVLVNVNEIDTTYMDTVLEGMTKWQVTVALAITDMHTDDCAVQDAKRIAIDEATWDLWRGV